ncbi:hypothetical protein ACVWZV_009623 [Bradyrhizobium sp. GM5.1]
MPDEAAVLTIESKTNLVAPARGFMHDGVSTTHNKLKARLHSGGRLPHARFCTISGPK